MQAGCNQECRAQEMGMTIRVVYVLICNIMSLAYCELVRTEAPIPIAKLRKPSRFSGLGCLDLVADSPVAR
jgi:hypothetical protein